MTDTPDQTAEVINKQVELIISEWKRSVYRGLSLSTMTLLAELAIKALRSQKP